MNLNSKVVLVTGGFDPIHSGHLKYIEQAKKLGDYLVVGVNSDAWLIRKKGSRFMPLSERQQILSAIRWVDLTIQFVDDDNSAKDAIARVRQMFPANKIIFANGGDRNKTNIPEMSIEDDNIEFVFGVGGEHKANSSSWILNEFKNNIK
jgi:cytidyltransferase-like protein